MKYNQFVLVIAATSAMGAPALAQEGSAGEDAIIVTAARTSAPAPTAARSVLDAEDLERRQTVFVADALAQLPGVNVAQNGAFGGQASVRIRGAASEQTLILIDGIAVNDPTSPGGGFNAAYLDASDIARIEVLRGPQSTLWGSDAIGGVVNIITRRPGEGFSGRAFAETGSYGTVRAGGGVGYGGEGLDIRLGASLIGADGISKADEDDGATEDDGYDNATLDGRIGLDVAPNLRVEAFGRVSESETDFDTFGFDTGVADGDDSERLEERSGGLNARYSLFDGQFENLLLVSRAELERRTYSGGAEQFRSEGARDALRYQGTWRPHDAFTLAFGAEREESEVERSEGVRIDGLFVQAEGEVFDGLTLSAGLRRDDHSRFGDVTTRRFGVRWTPADMVSVRASWGEGFKAPTIFQLTSFFPPATAPNPDLAPEEAEGWDAAILLHLSDRRVEAELGYFDLETNNLINFADGRYANIAHAESTGVEASLRATLSADLTLAASYTYIDAVNAATGVRLIRVPEHSAFVELDWRIADAIGLTATARYNGEEADIVRPANPEGRVDAWTRFDLAARYTWSERVELYARIENVGDANYQDTFGYGAPARSAYGGVRVRFE